jgi:hypothetical protein
MRKRLHVAAVLIAAAILIVLVCIFAVKRPFLHLNADDIASAEVFLIPPDVTIPITDRAKISELAAILREIRLYEVDDSGRYYNGQLVQATIVLNTGETHTIGAYGSFLFLDGVCYRTEYAPSQALNAFGNGCRNGE